MTTVCVEWGSNGIRALSERASVFIIVDVLSFSTAVDIALSCGAAVYPLPLGDREAAEKAAADVGAVLATPRKAAGGQFSLSPKSLLSVPTGLKLMLPSPNGSRLTFEVQGKSVLAACLRNAVAVAKAARALAQDGDIAIIPAGERWPDGSLRPAIEDWLGAGAVADALDLPGSAEAEMARAAFNACSKDFGELVRASRSGQELIDAGFAGDVELAVEASASSTVPFLRDGAYRQFSAPV